MPVAQKMFVVSGRGAFPIDMLRYDSAWPERTEDAHAIAATFDAPGARSNRWEIRLLSADRMAPTRGRWDSFNVHVTGEGR